jgi:hypothetical protein
VRAFHTANTNITTFGGIALIAANYGTGTATNITGGSFNGRNDAGGTSTNVTGGNFLAASNSTGTATTLKGGLFTASCVAGAKTTTVKGIEVNATCASSSAFNTLIGIDVLSLGAGAALVDKWAIRTGAIGRWKCLDTTEATTLTDGSVSLAGGLSVAKNIQCKNAWLLSPRTDTEVFDANNWVSTSFASTRWIDGYAANLNLPPTTTAGMIHQFDSLFGIIGLTGKYRVQEFTANNRWWKRSESNGVWSAWREMTMV